MSLSPIELLIASRPRSIGAFRVRRVLPAVQRRLVGPFVFLDHLGPLDFAPGQGADVLPHPHIHLATVTYLFEGSLVHRDSTGAAQAIEPGAVNLMHAGRGVAHSERTAADVRARGQRLHGIQLWLALPQAAEETDPSFRHYPAEAIPRTTLPGAELSVVIGAAFGVPSPVAAASPTLYVEARLEPGAEISAPDGYAARAAYVVEGSVESEGGGAAIEGGTLAVFREGAAATLRARARSRVMLLGGAPLDGPRHIWWNFVSSSKERIERAKREWREGRFAPIPGDDAERVPLPEEPNPPAPPGS